jgi:hypothetical protein
MEPIKYAIVERPGTTDTRYDLINTETGEELDNAYGYGYKTIENAKKAAKFKFPGSIFVE